jgi:hypothetical protein
MAVTLMGDITRVVSLELYRRQLQDANPNQWLLDQLGREAAIGIRMQAGTRLKTRRWS